MPSAPPDSSPGGKNRGSILMVLVVCFGIAALAFLAWRGGPKDTPLNNDYRSAVAACGLALLLWKIWDAWRSR